MEFAVAEDVLEPWLLLQAPFSTRAHRVPNAPGEDRDFLRDPWRDPRAIPFYITALSLAVLCMQFIVVSLKRRPNEPPTSKHSLASLMERMDTPAMQRHMTARRVGELTRAICCGVLVGTTVSWTAVGVGGSYADDASYWLLSIAYLYSALLSILYVLRPSLSWPPSHITAVQFSALAIWVHRDVVPMATGLPPPLPDAVLPWHTWGTCALLVLTGAVIPGLLPWNYIPPTLQLATSPPPMELASPFSRIYYFYVESLVRAAYKKPKLSSDDLPPILESEAAAYLKERSFPIFDPKLTGKPASLIRGIFRYFSWDITIMIIGIFGRALNDFAGPVATLRILSYLETSDHEGMIRPWVWIIWLALGPQIGSLSIQYMLHVKTHVIVRIEAILTQLIFDHILRVRLNTAVIASNDQGKEKGKQKASTRGASAASSAATSGTTTPIEGENPVTAAVKKEAANQAGGVNNLVTVDIKNVTEAFEFQWIGTLIRIFGAFVLLYKILSWSALVGLVILIIALPVPAYFVKMRGRLAKGAMKMADARLQAVTQSLNVLRMVKLFGWEAQVEAKISEKRKAELRYLWWNSLADTGATYVTSMFPLAAMISTYACYLFNMLRNAMQSISWEIPRLIKGKVAIDRMALFLNSGEFLATAQVHDVAAVPAERHSKVTIRDVQFTWKSAAAAEADLDIRNFKLRIDGELHFVPGKISLITGPTGCGKSSLLMSILGELVITPLSPVSVCHLGREDGVAYATQESWVLNETIKENILFGSPYHEERYRKVLRQCALERDIALFKAGDLTEVGEKGITLSGGQKARITLARAVYSSAAVVLLDDVLSALDVHTARWIVHECFAGDLLRGRTVLLVTHNVELASRVADYIVVLSFDGTIESRGPVADVTKRQPSLTVDDTAVDKKDIDTTDEAQELKQESGKLIVAEDIALGRVGWQSYNLYLGSFGGPLFLAFALGCHILMSLTPLMQTAWLAHWSDQYTGHQTEDVDVKWFLMMYALICVGGMVIGAGGSIIYVLGVIRACTTIHSRLVHSVITSSFRWLDITPVSRVIARCSQDINAVDGVISGRLQTLTMLVLMIVITSTTVTAVAGWQMLLPALGVVMIGVVVGHVYMKSQLPVKRLLSNAKAPILGHIQTAMSGLVSVRAYSAEATFRKEMAKRMDDYSTIAHPYWDLNRWVAVRIDLLGSLFTATLATVLVYGKNTVAPGTIGFTLALISNFNSLLLTLVRVWNTFEVESNSLERIRAFLLIDHEPEATEQGKPPAYWPASGELVVQNLSARYSSDSPEVLKDVSFNAKSGERIGVVGRTGAGKSTLGLALLRAIPTTGDVRLDGLNLNALNLDAVRSSISIIPQSPDLLAGTLRENLDPLNEHDDAILNDALNSAGMTHLKSDTTNNRITLDSVVDSGGANFSQGQRQIIALARAFIRQSRVLIMDEATAAIDYETDRLIQRFIREQFSSATVITVAHRLQTIMDSDKILVLEAGQLVENDSPKELLALKQGVFKSLVEESSDKRELYTLAGI